MAKKVPATVVADNLHRTEYILKQWIRIKHWILSPIQCTVPIFDINFKRTINCPITRLI